MFVFHKLFQIEIVLNSILCAVKYIIYNQLKQHMFPTVPEVKIQALEENIKEYKANGPFLVLNSNKDVDHLRKSGEWNVTENAKYAAFLEFNAQQFQGKAHGKLWGKYQQMAKFVKSRNFRQCKSHHQKLLSQHKFIPNIINALTNKNPSFQEVLLKQKQNYQTLKYQQNSVKSLENRIVDNPENSKQKNEDKVPTAIEYRDEQLQGSYQNGNKLLKPSSFNYSQNYQPPNTLNPVCSLQSSQKQYFNQNKYLNFPTSHHMPFQMPVMYQFQHQSKEQKWKQCHMLFLEWMTRLNELNQMMSYDF